MALKDFVGRLRSSDDYVELEHQEEQQGDRQLWIEIEKMDNFGDSDRIQKKIREGNILLVRIRELRAKDSEELKRCVERVRRTCLAINGDIAGLGEDWLLVTPSAAKVYREPKEE